MKEKDPELPPPPFLLKFEPFKPPRKAETSQSRRDNIWWFNNEKIILFSCFGGKLGCWRKDPSRSSWGKSFGAEPFGSGTDSLPSHPHSASLSLSHLSCSRNSFPFLFRGSRFPLSPTDFASKESVLFRGWSVWGRFSSGSKRINLLAQKQRRCGSCIWPWCKPPGHWECRAPWSCSLAGLRITFMADHVLAEFLVFALDGGFEVLELFVEDHL